MVISRGCRFAVLVDIFLQEPITEARNGRGVAFGLSLGGWVVTTCDRGQKLLGLASGFVGGQDAVLTDGDAPCASSGPVLDKVGLLPDG